MASNQGRGTGKSSSNASTRKKTTNGKNTGSRTGGAKKRRGEPMTLAIRNEILLIVFFALAVILFLCNFGIVGTVGNAVSSFLFGIFGLMAYVAPVIIFLSIAFGMSNIGNHIATRKLVAGIVLFLIISMVFELINADYTQMDTYRIVEIYKRCSENRSGGGIIAGSLAYALHKLLGMVGTVLAMIVIAIICAVIVTDKSFINGVASQGRKVYERSMEDAAYRRERASIRAQEMEERRAKEAERRKQQEEEKENEKILRMDKKVSGVMIDTALGIAKDDISAEDRQEEARLRDDIHEIMINDEADVEEEPVRKSRDTYHFIENASDELDEIKLPVEEDEPGETERDDSMADEEKIYETPAPRIVKERPAAAFSDKEPENSAPAAKVYHFPPYSRLAKGKGKGNGSSDKELKETAQRLQQTLNTFGVKVTISDISQGPSVTRYELQPEQGVKVSKIVGLADDIKLNLAATDIRIEAPIPGKAAVGIEVPNKENAAVALRDLLESKEFKDFPSNLAFAVGKDIGGKIVVTDIAKMPHMLIAGATGSGKSVCINTIIMGILYKAHPDDVKMIMIDPKVVELSVYNGIPHLLIPVVTDPKKAAAALHWGVAEMTERYKKFADYNVRDLKGYNKKVESMKAQGDSEAPEKLPQILIIVDELADLMMVAPGEVEESICRLAQLARACGIHLVIATQRPSVDVITGLIKANMPSRIAFAVSSGVDSRTILDMVGAEKLLGKGDMLFYPQGYPKPARVQGAFVSDKEVSDVVDFLKNQAIGNVYSEDIEEKIKNIGTAAGGANSAGGADSSSEYDQYFAEAGRFIIEKDKASIGMLQRVFKIGFNRAARIMDQLCEAGVVGEEEGTKPRKVLMTEDEFEQLVEEII
ncbi:MAG: DNA translocase FtsK [Bacillus sp. (in: Bacteria)]|nr:DNA translocase FtsK [Bacillus sp. (in: firmicutes)]MCM1426792.1 DNA translocase FtsK [Eubacterium sp.]